MDLTHVIFVPTILFLVIVAPLWLSLHYTNQKRMQKQLSAVEHDELLELSQVARKMAERISTLEAILDSETPGWRKSRDMP